jgi:hypothetical protein
MEESTVNTSNENHETFSQLWLDAAVNESEENRAAQQQLRATINHIRTFDNANECEEYIRRTADDRIVLIVSGQMGKKFVPHIHDIRQLYSIYVYCFDREIHQKWSGNFVKVKVRNAASFLIENPFTKRKRKSLPQQSLLMFVT